jgi:hypothetical protein
MNQEKKNNKSIEPRLIKLNTVISEHAYDSFKAEMINRKLNSLSELFEHLACQLEARRK